MSSGTKLYSWILGRLVLCVALCFMSFFSAAKTETQLGAFTLLSDEDLAEVTGQALVVTNRISGDGGNLGSSGVTFYNAGLDVELSLNMNIKSLELGRTGTSPLDVDIWAENVAFGCTADGAGNCVASDLATQLRGFVLSRPYIQFAIENDETPFRNVVGVRIGAEGVEGPLSIGEFKSFSGYLNAEANINMQGQSDIAATCGPSTGPCRGGGNHSTGVNWLGYEEPLQSLGLDNERECILFVACVEFRQITVRYDGVSRQNLPVVVSGSRQSQAFIQNARLGDAVDQIVFGGNGSNPMRIDQTQSVFGTSILNLVLPLIRNSAASKIKSQLAAGLGIPVSQLNTHSIPYNVSNLHQVMVDSPDFGLSFQKRDLAYPGYVAEMTSGWTMYMPDAFTLNIDEPTTVFVSNIAQGDAAAGNIVGLPGVFDNCWGAATFC